MTSTLLTAGLACLVAAIVGGGLKAFGVEILIVASTNRQLLLGVVGVLLLGGALIVVQRPDAQSKQQDAPQSREPPPEIKEPQVLSSPFVATERVPAVWKRNYELITGPLGRYEIPAIGLKGISGPRVSEMLKQLDLTGESVLEKDKASNRGHGASRSHL